MRVLPAREYGLLPRGVPAVPTAGQFLPGPERGGIRFARGLEDGQ